MPFTSELGTIDSRLTNVPLGFGPRVFTVTASNTLTFVQNADVIIPAIDAGNTLTFVQLATCTVVRTRNATNTLTFTQTANYGRNLFENASNVLTFTQTARIASILDLTASNTLTFAQSVTRHMVRVRPATNELIFNQSSTRSATFHRTASNQLIFNQYNRRTLPVNNQEIVTLPATVIVKPRKCVVIMQTAQNVIVLPCPILGDTQSNQGTLIVKRSMNNVLRTYVRNHELQQLKYTFQINRMKGLELREFIHATIGIPIFLFNWKGEEWVVNITNNPVELTMSERWEPVRERVDVTLEYQGVKIAG